VIELLQQDTGTAVEDHVDVALEILINQLIATQMLFSRHLLEINMERNFMDLLPFLELLVEVNGWPLVAENASNLLDKPMSVVIQRLQQLF
jgi:uncharacterized protein YebE (UPF0316 family)